MINKNTHFIGKVLLAFDTISSTNTYALELLSKSEPKEGTVITASYQTEGRGQIGSKWTSEAGKNMMMSIILYPSFVSLKDQFVLNQACALAVRDTFAAYINHEVYVKWPNDIYIGQYKVAGLLLQSAISGQKLQYCVVGLGANVNQGAFPSEIPNASSLYNITGQKQDLDGLRDTFFHQLELRYFQLKAKQYDLIKADYLRHMYGFGQQGIFERPDGVQFTGTITGINSHGHLLLKHDMGEEAFQLKQISLVSLVLKH
ncbi:MAG: biotin--[acetyl-CoA-carboxylase] ligase [Chitinophagales bacterium]|nr:biotin--[acetyl-CoA-carboxylase] ligase [Chitinophagales bacterium]